MRTTNTTASSTSNPQCFGCGKCCEATALKRCTRCMRAVYCSRECQVGDWAIQKHKGSFAPNLLAHAMDNIHRLDVSHKMALIASGQSDLVSNCNINQTMCRITCPDVQTFIGGATVEYSNLQSKIRYGLKTGEQALSKIQGNCMTTFTDGQCGVDLGVDSLCAAQQLWPGVFTVNSCFGLHVVTSWTMPLTGQDSSRDGEGCTGSNVPGFSNRWRTQ